MDLAWMDRAACAGMDAALFFPTKGRRDSEYEAKKICVSCPVKLRCRDHALDHPSECAHGVWGGLNARERVRARRQRRLNTAR